MTSSRSGIRAIAAALCLAVVTGLSAGCNDQPTTVMVENDYPVPSASEPGMTVFKVWWVTTLLPSPVAPGETSAAERTIPASDFAYALLAPGWSPDSTTPPNRLIALKSAQKLTSSVHDVLTIAVSDQEFAGDCAAGSALNADDAQLIVERVFPGEFAGVTYDPATCTAAAPTDGGPTADAGTD
jgi:hypothetical protein